MRSELVTVMPKLEASYCPYCANRDPPSTTPRPQLQSKRFLLSQAKNSKHGCQAGVHYGKVLPRRGMATEGMVENALLLVALPAGCAHTAVLVA